jgi:hypothetical protein
MYITIVRGAIGQTDDWPMIRGALQPILPNG